ncbi:MAG: hypothetical protein ACOYNN_19250 [Terrimicrobiaceae bacterium]
MAYDDWSDLITVNYKGGYGGEFFSFLLYESYHGEVNYIQYKDSKTRYEFASLDPLNETPLFWFNRLDHKREVTELSNYCDLLIENRLNKIKSICYSKDRKEYISNLRYYFSDNYFPKHLKNNVTKMHNTINDENSIYIHEVFPKSKNYNLICKNESEHFIFRILFFYKVLAKYCMYYENQNIIFTRHGFSKKITLNDFFYDNFPFFKSKEKGIEINVFDFYINRKYEFDLNEKKLNTYRDSIFDIMEKFKIDVFHTYTQSEMYEILEKYLKRNNAPT